LPHSAGIDLLTKSCHGDKLRTRMRRQKFFDLMAVGAVESNAEFFHEKIGQNLKIFGKE
jgi:hypothetical protein